MNALPKVGTRWQHYGGVTYTVLHIANDGAPSPSERYPVMVVYQGPNGKIWARRADDWHRSMKENSQDGR